MGKNVSWKKSKDNIFESFAIELQEYTYNDVVPSLGDQDMVYFLELQRNRLKEKNLTMRYDFSPRGILSYDMDNKGWQDNKYIYKPLFRSCNVLKRYYCNNRLLMKKSKKIIFHQLITDVFNQKNIGEDVYKCPSCGNLEKIKELQNGCKYCRTHFKIDELFPKVTSYFLCDDLSGGGSNEMFKEILLFDIPFALFFAIFMAFSNYSSVMSNVSGEFGYSDVLLSALSSVFLSLIGGFLLGLVVGLFAWAFYRLLLIIFYLLKVRSMRVESKESKDKYVVKIKQYINDFSYDYFISKVLSFVKMIIFSDNPEDLPIYMGDKLQNCFRDVVDSSWRGYVGIKDVRVMDRYMYITTNVYLENLYYKNNHIYKKNEKLIVTFRKDITRLIDYNFSITRISCKSCGGSFDATKNKKCIFCNTLYDVDDDWLITSVKK